jgi:competence protein ComEC
MQSVPHQRTFSPYPLAQLAAAFAVGILAAKFSPVPLPALLILLGVASILAWAALLRARGGLTTLFITIAIFFAGALLASIQTHRVPPNQLKRLLDNGELVVGNPVELTGVLVRQPESSPQGFYLNLRVEKLMANRIEKTASGEVSVLVASQGKPAAEEYKSLELRYGARIRVMTTLKRADNFRNPGGSSFTEYLERKGYDAMGFVKSALLIERLDDDRVFVPLAWLYEWRQLVEEQINFNFSRQTAGVLNAALLGNRYYLSHATAERFREGGTFHILVISGLHISFLGGLVFLIARRLTRRKWWQFLTSAAVLWSYTLAVGAEASVVRAALMFSLIAFAPVVARRGASLNALGAAALLLLIWRPSELFDPSFQLTFLSVLAIVVLAWPLLERMAAIGSWRLTRETPYPPSCALWLRSLCEALFWSDRKWKREIAQLNHSYRLLKTPLAERLERYHVQFPLRYAFSAIVISVCVQLTLLPLLIVYFHRLSLSSLLLNIFVSVTMAALSLVAISGLALAQVSSGLAGPFIAAANALNWLMVHSVDGFTKVGLTSLRLPEYTGWMAATYPLYYLPLAGLTILLCRWQPLGRPYRTSPKSKGDRWLKTALVAELISLAILVAHPFSADRPDGGLHVDFLDVGQGDAALITTPDGTTLLIDGGGRPNFSSPEAGANEAEEDPYGSDTRSIGEAVVSEYLWWRGLDHLDYIVASHADADHIDGLNDVTRNFQVGTALVGRVPGDDPEFARFATTAASRSLPISVIGAGDALKLGEATVDVLWPRALEDPAMPSRNDDSVVLLLRFGEHSILLTGDIESRAEEGLLKGLERQQDLHVDVVKVAHHGSRSSSTEAFVKATQPRFAIISVGQTSVFGHPNRDVVERWKARGAEVLTTGKSGTISVTTDGQTLHVATFVKE